MARFASEALLGQAFPQTVGGPEVAEHHTLLTQPTSFKATRYGPPPPIQCEEPTEEDRLELLELRSAGEIKSGRKDGPATEELQRLLASKDKAAGATPPPAPAAPDKAKKMHKIVTRKSFNRVERVHVPDDHVKAASKKQAAGLKKPKLPLGPGLPSRTQILQMGPYPLEKAISVLGAHAYYLNGEAKYLTHVSEGQPVDQLAHTIEKFTRKADTSARRLFEAARIPLSSSPPNLPLAVSALPAPAALLAYAAPMAAPAPVQPESELGPELRCDASNAAEEEKVEYSVRPLSGTDAKPLSYKAAVVHNFL